MKDKKDKAPHTSSSIAAMMRAQAINQEFLQRNVRARSSATQPHHVQAKQQPAIKLPHRPTPPLTNSIAVKRTEPSANKTGPKGIEQHGRLPHTAKAVQPKPSPGKRPQTSARPAPKAGGVIQGPRVRSILQMKHNTSPATHGFTARVQRPLTTRNSVVQRYDEEATTNDDPRAKRARANRAKSSSAEYKVNFATVTIEQRIYFPLSALQKNPKIGEIWRTCQTEKIPIGFLFLME